MKISYKDVKGVRFDRATGTASFAICVDGHNIFGKIKEYRRDGEWFRIFDDIKSKEDIETATKYWYKNRINVEQGNIEADAFYDKVLKDASE